MPSTSAPRMMAKLSWLLKLLKKEVSKNVGSESSAKATTTACRRARQSARASMCKACNKETSEKRTKSSEEQHLVFRKAPDARSRRLGYALADAELQKREHRNPQRLP